MSNLLEKSLSNIENKYLTRGEREFCAELYHQLRNGIEKQGDIEVTTETVKNITYNYSDPILNDPLIRVNFFMKTLKRTLE